MRGLRRKADQWNFRRNTRDVLSTAPIKTTPDGPRFVSLVCNRDVLPYLVAIKSVYQRIQRGSIVVLNDGSLTAEDKAILNHHLDGPQFYHVDDIDKGPCPTYICWSRLLLIADLVKNDYVIQVDADIVAQAELPEIKQCLDDDTGFIITNRIHPGRATFKEATAWLEQQGWEADTVQIRAERGLATLPDADNRYYVRGSAAFVGFPKNSITRQQIYRFSEEVEPIAGDLWRKWGSEQTTTNHVVGQMDRLQLLEYPSYVNHTPQIQVDEAKVVHFFGTHRYKKGRYVKSARRAILDIKVA